MRSKADIDTKQPAARLVVRVRLMSSIRSVAEAKGVDPVPQGKYGWRAMSASGGIAEGGLWGRKGGF
jgi:hypothetical protein